MRIGPSTHYALDAEETTPRTPLNPPNKSCCTSSSSMVSTEQNGLASFSEDLCRLPRSKWPSCLKGSWSLQAPQPALSGLVDRPLKCLHGGCPALDSTPKRQLATDSPPQRNLMGWWAEPPRHLVPQVVKLLRPSAPPTSDHLEI